MCVVSLEGALGKITSLTVRNPRQVLEVTDKKSNNATQEGSLPNQKSMVCLCERIKKKKLANKKLLAQYVLDE